MSAEYTITQQPLPGEKFLQIAIFIVLGWLLYASLAGHVFQPLWETVTTLDWPQNILLPSIWWAAMGLLLLGYRTILWLRYKCFPVSTAHNAPVLTVIIPAYNEGTMVEKTIDSVAAADYPAGRLEIFVVDDGSRDDTWEYISRAARRHPGLGWLSRGSNPSTSAR